MPLIALLTMFMTTTASASIPFPLIDPVAVYLGPLPVRWYGLAYIVGITLSWYYARALVKDERLWFGNAGVSLTDLDDLLTWIVVGVVAGGRLGYAILYQPGLLSSPADLIAVWEGGMSFHGGLLGVTVAMLLFTRRRSISVWPTLDVVAAAAPLGLFFGRIANFINAELWGAPTAMPWGIVFPGAGPEPRHPSQLYEAGLEGIVLFLVLRWLTHSRGALSDPGRVSGTFIAGYGIARILVEFVRVPDAHVGYLAGHWLTLGMVYSLPMVLVGVWALLLSAHRVGTIGR